MESLIKEGADADELGRQLCRHPKQALNLLRKIDKSKEEYERKFKLLYLQFCYFVGLCLRDGELNIKAIEFGSLKYMGQVRLNAVYQTSDISGPN